MRNETHCKSCLSIPADKVLYQGTTSVVLKDCKINAGFRPCGLHYRKPP